MKIDENVRLNPDDMLQVQINRQLLEDLDALVGVFIGLVPTDEKAEALDWLTTHEELFRRAILGAAVLNQWAHKAGIRAELPNLKDVAARTRVMLGRPA